MSPPAAMFTVVGEALVDVIVAAGSPEPVHHPGGSAANVAVALSRLGQRAALVTQLGADRYGDLLRGHLAGNGVRLLPAGPASAPTSRAVARLDAAGAASYQFELSWDVSGLRLAEGSAGLHVGSLGTVLAPGDEQVRGLAEDVSRRGGAVVSYDPNVRPSVTPDRRQAAAEAGRLAALAHVVKLSDEDLGWLYPGTSPRELAGRWLGQAARVTRLLVVTLGERGAFVATRSGCWQAPAVPVAVADTVGAGDAFTAGLLAGLAGAGLLSPDALGRCAAADLAALRRITGQAMAAAALTCSRPGADPPTAAELRSFLASRAEEPADS